MITANESWENVYGYVDSAMYTDGLPLWGAKASAGTSSSFPFLDQGVVRVPSNWIGSDDHVRVRIYTTYVHILSHTNHNAYFETLICLWQIISV